MPNIPPNLNTIIHIGAGLGLELADYLQSSARRIILVEPNPGLANKLRGRAEQDARVQVVEVAITVETELNRLNEFNLPAAASLYKPDGLYRLFPNLRVVASHSVETQTLEHLLRNCLPENAQSGPEASNLLVVQAPGAEQAIFEALASSKWLEQFNHIRFTSSEQSYYESGSHVGAVLPLLEKSGFELKDTNDANSDRPEWTLAFDQRAHKIKTLEKEIEDLKVRHQQELDKWKATQQDAEQLLQRMESLFERQSLQLNQAARKLSQHVSSSVEDATKELKVKLQQQGPSKS